MSKKHLFVTKSFLPPLNEYVDYLNGIWERNQLTNEGPIHKEFEKKLAQYLNVKEESCNFVQNGTLALQLIIDGLELSDCDIITTPFTYIATTSAILWQKNRPIFVDIQEDKLTINPSLIEDAITPKTKAILAVHVFGNPCDVTAIEKIAKKHNLKVIYDAAHAFNVTYNGKQLIEYGDASIYSFHATKQFHTIEGGLVYSNSQKLSEHIRLSKRFGHEGDDHRLLGINAKPTELQAAMGLLNLKYVKSNSHKRRLLSEYYSKKIDTSKFRIIPSPNNSYFPILVKDQAKLMKVLEILSNEQIYPRRYFYPSINTIKYINSNQSCPVSESVTQRILALPFYESISNEEIDKITELLNNA